jgi:hypothetical protein
VPGKILDSLDFFQQPVPEIPDNFVVLMLQLVQVDFLDLTRSPHQRTRYQLINGLWQDERINP